MPVSGNEELAINTRTSTNCSAGLPIKKRRFPLFQHPSPPPQEPCSLDGKNDLLKSKPLTLSQESSGLDGGLVGNSSGPSSFDANMNLTPVVKKEIPNDTGVNTVPNSLKLQTVPVQEPNLTRDSGFVGSVESKEKLFLAAKSTCQKVNANPDVNLPPNEGGALNIGKNILSRQQVERLSNVVPNAPKLPEMSVQGPSLTFDMGFMGNMESKEKFIVSAESVRQKIEANAERVLPTNAGFSSNEGKIMPTGQQVEKVCKLELSTTHDNAAFSLGPKDPLVPSLKCQSSDEGHKLSDKLDSSSHSLSSSKGEAITEIKSEVSRSNIGCASVPANRSLWDLNTTMDAWEEGIEGEASVHGSVDNDGLSKSSAMPDSKPSTSSNELALFGGVDAGKRFFAMGEHRLNVATSSTIPYSHKSTDSLCLSLSPSFCQSNLTREFSSSSTRLDSTGILGGSLPGDMVSTGNMTSAACRNVKSESCDENDKHRPLVSGKGLLDSFTVKHEILERQSTETVQSSNVIPHKMVLQGSVKPEPVHEAHRTMMVIPEQSVAKVVQTHDSCSNVSIPSMPTTSCSSGLPSSSELPLSGGVKENCTITDTPKETSESVDRAVANSLPYIKESNMNGISETSTLRSTDEHNLELRGNNEGRSGSDEEKTSIPAADMVEEDSYNSDTHMDIEEGRQLGGEDDEYEDGEVREPLVDKGVDGSTGEEKEGAENTDCNKNVDLPGSPCYDDDDDDNKAQPVGAEKNVKIEDCCEMGGDHIKECINTVSSEKSELVVGIDGGFMQETPTEKMAADDGVDGEMSMEISNGSPVVQLGGEEEVQQRHEGDDGANNGGEEIVSTCMDNIKGSDVVENPDSTFSKPEPSLSGNDAAAKDANTTRSRIIHLPRASNVTSPVKPRFIPGRSLSSRSGRDRYTDFNEEKLHSRGNRDELYSDGPRKFMRDRMQDNSFRKSRPNFVRGRGRFSNRVDSLRGQWDSDEIYDDYRFGRHKRASVADEELEHNNNNNGFVGGSRGGRKCLNDEMPPFRRNSSRRLSPRGSSRDGHEAGDIHMVRRIPRNNISPNRFTDDDGSDLNDIVQAPSPYEAMEGQFVRGNRNFSSFQRRENPRIRSKSPIRSRTRSPGPWLSPRRRSPGGFNGIPELNPRRSPTFFRIERLRSPDRPCFPDSPPFMARSSNDFRDSDSGRKNGPPTRSPSGRRFEVLDNARERQENDEYFGVGERRRHVRTFRAPYNDGDDETFHFHRENGPRGFRFCPENDSPQTMERGNGREREFVDRRINNRPLNGPRRIRSMEDQEGNFRQNGRNWHDDGFDDVASRGKRRRF